MTRVHENAFRNGSSTEIIELQEPGPTLRLENDIVVSSPDAIPKDHEHSTSLPSPVTAVAALQRWNNPKANKYRTFATFYTFVVLGLNDGAYGVSQL